MYQSISMALSGDPLILVTGASGFLATHVVQQLLQTGQRVRATVRSIQNEHKIQPVRKLSPKGSEHLLELVEADLENADSWLSAVRGCTYVIHTASPFPNKQPTKEEDLIKPAVDGTLAVLRACAEVGGVKRVVLTSSIVAINGNLDPNKKTGEFTEEDWTDTKQTMTMPAYTKSKTLAERAAWEYVEGLPDGEDKFELAVINPGYVMGPVLSGGWATSLEIPKQLMEKKIPSVPDISFCLVDVRDAAAAHIAAMTSPEAAGRRHITAPHPASFRDIARILSNEFSKYGYKVPTKQAPLPMMKLVSLFNKQAKMILSIWGRRNTYDNTRMTQVLGIRPRELNETVLEMAYSMIERGFIKKTKQYQKEKE